MRATPLLRKTVLRVLFAGAFAGSLFSPAAAQTDPIPNVFIVTLSGVRNIESVNDPSHQHIPHLWGELFPQGTLYMNLVDLNHEFHMPSVVAINTGVPEKYMVPKLIYPTIFQYVRKQYHWPTNKLWMVGAWTERPNGVVSGSFSEDTLPCYLTARMAMCDDLKVLFSEEERTFAKRHIEVVGNTWLHWDSQQKDSLMFFERALRAFHPKLVHLVLDGTDSAHYGTYGRYVNAIKQSDQDIYDLFQMIQQDPFYRDNTYLIVSPDHQRNAYYMQHNESRLGSPPPIWLYIYGPNVKKGAVIDRLIHHVDVFPTMARIMGVEVPQTEAKVLKECFEDSREP